MPKAIPHQVVEKQLTTRRKVANDRHHRLGGGSAFEGLQKIVATEHLGDARQGVKVPLELALRNQEQGHQMNGLIVQSVEVNPTSGTAKGGNHLGDHIGGGMRNSNSKSDAGAHGLLSFLDDGSDGFPVFRKDAPTIDQNADELINGFPSAGGL